jgi:hypothetical protein
VHDLSRSVDRSRKIHSRLHDVSLQRAHQRWDVLFLIGYDAAALSTGEEL